MARAANGKGKAAERFAGEILRLRVATENRKGAIFEEGIATLRSE